MVQDTHSPNHQQQQALCMAAAFPQSFGGHQETSSSSTSGNSGTGTQVGHLVSNSTSHESIDHQEGDNGDIPTTWFDDDMQATSDIRSIPCQRGGRVTWTIEHISSLDMQANKPLYSPIIRIAGRQ
jgi:hypothetical protein